MNKWDKILIGLASLAALAVVLYLALGWLRKRIPESQQVADANSPLLKLNSGLNALSIATLAAWVTWHETLLLLVFGYVLVPATVAVAIINTSKL